MHMPCFILPFFSSCRPLLGSLLRDDHAVIHSLSGPFLQLLFGVRSPARNRLRDGMHALAASDRYIASGLSVQLSALTCSHPLRATRAWQLPVFLPSARRVVRVPAIILPQGPGNRVHSSAFIQRSRSGGGRDVGHQYADAALAAVCTCLFAPRGVCGQTGLRAFTMLLGC
jgi:hypothetical protein